MRPVRQRKNSMTPRAPSVRASGYAVLLAAAIAGCSQDTTEPNAGTTAKTKPSPPATVLKLRAPESGSKPFLFDTKRLTAKPGRIRIEFTNEDLGEGHNVRIQTGRKCCFGSDAKDLGGTETISHGTTSADLDLKPGKYWFLCAPITHWSEGMKGRLIVH
jgi:plastocyanin